MDPQANLPAAREPKAQITAGGQVAALVPRNLDEAFRLSTAIASSGLAPKGIEKPEQIMVAIMAGAELGLAPFQSLQSFAVVNGRPTLWGDGLVAVVRARGVRIREWIDGEGEHMVARCEVVRPDTGETIPGEFSVAEAKKANLWGKAGPWQQYPRRMLKARARAFALRDGCADMLRGIQVREEVEDYHDAQVVRTVDTPAPTGLRARLESRAAQPSEGFTAATAEPVIEGEIVETANAPAEAETVRPAITGMKTGAQLLKEQTPTLADRALGLETSLRNASTAEELAEAWAHADGLRFELDAKDPDRLAELEQLMSDREEALG